MSPPKVAIVGRPNVGKSSILNWLARKLVSVVDPTAGVTRDRVVYTMTEQGKSFELVDTGGVGIVDSDALSEHIERQIQYGLNSADLVLFVVDGQAGVTPLDEMVAERLRKLQCPKILVVNKCDSTKLDDEIHVFHKLADAPIVVTSVKGQRNRAELMDAILKELPDRGADAGPGQSHGPDCQIEAEMKLAIVGRRNVGKSTFINQLADEERVIVSEIPGTTRDSVDVRFEMDGRSFIAIDTPGVRKKKSLANDIEFYGLVRAQKSIRRADVILMFFDATQTISQVDKQLVEDIQKHQKPCIFVVNKWDRGLKADMTTDRWGNYLLETFATMPYAPVAFLTAIDGKNVHPVINLAQAVFKQSRERVPTSQLNEIVAATVRRNPPPNRKNRRPKIYFATQVGIEPPTIVLKCNEPKLFDAAWKRYLLSALRESLPFQEVPLRVYYRKREREEREDC